MRKTFAISLIIVVGAAPLAAFACSEVFAVDPSPKQSSADCSFADFGITAQWSGEPVIDIGDGKISQMIVSSISCPYQEKLLLADCSKGESVNVDGVNEPSIQAAIDREEFTMLGGDLLIKYIQPPFGPVEISSRSRVEEVEATASSAGYVWSNDIVRDFRRDNRKRREWLKMVEVYAEGDEMMTEILRHAHSREAKRPFDAMCGCKVFYPDSVGAKM